MDPAVGAGLQRHSCGPVHPSESRQTAEQDLGTASGGYPTWRSVPPRSCDRPRRPEARISSSFRRRADSGQACGTVPGASEPLLERLGRTVANRLGEIVEAYVSLDDVRELASASDVRSIKAVEPDSPRVMSQGTQAHNAAHWHAGGQAGAGVKVGIIDEFGGILQLLGNELPATVVARCYTSVGVYWLIVGRMQRRRQSRNCGCRIAGGHGASRPALHRQSNLQSR